MFVKALNQETMKYGIRFPLEAVQFGKSVDFLEVSPYLDEDNKIQYKGFTKPTDSKRYLNPKSFHPRAVFDSIPYSQLLRTVRNNSKEETRNAELEQRVKDFAASGYDPNVLETIKAKVITRNSVHGATNSTDDTEEELVFPVHYFDKIKEFKSVVHSLKDEIKELIGDTKVMFAIKKQSSIGNTMVLNKQLSTKNTTTNGQKCNAPGCMQCPLVNQERRLMINGIPLTVPRFLNCKSKSIIYLWLCNLCDDEPYFGRTIQACRNRTSGHRSCFNNEDKVDKSALSMHAKECHQNNFSLNNFSVAVVRKVSPQQLRRQEFKFIDKFMAASKGLNRYKS